MSITVAASCALAIVESRVEVEPTHLAEQSHIEVVAEGPCRWVDLDLPPEVTLERLKGKVVLGDGQRYRIGPSRLDREVRDLDGRTSVRVWLPELLAGDRLVLDIERSWPSTLHWTGSARYSSLRIDDTIEAQIEGKIDQDGSRFRGGPDAGAVTLSHPKPAASTLPDVAELASVVQVQRELTLRLPERVDPLVALYPGGGSWVEVSERVTLPEGGSWVVPLRAGFSNVTVEGSLLHHLRDDSVLLTSRESGEAVLRYQAPDAPTAGEVRPVAHEQLTVQVEVEGGRVNWTRDRDAWRLTALDFRPIVPEWPVLIRAMDRRIRAASNPEPGLPNELRGRPADWSLAETLRTHLLDNYGVLPGDASPFPRRMARAKRERALTSLEASMMLWLWAQQAGFQSSWALVRPATAGPGHMHSPDGYTAGVVALNDGVETRWIDPGCTACAPFELRPELQDASMLSPIGERTPPTARGTLDITVSSDGASEVRLAGPAALSLRLALQGEADRDAALRSWLALPSDAEVSATGIDTLGGEIIVTADRPVDLFGVQPTPLPGAQLWMGWRGHRERTRPANPEDASTHRHAPGLCYTLRVDDGRATEHLEIAHRRVSDAAWHAVTTE